MKPDRNQDENDLDNLLFAYVEGELTGGQRQQLEARLASDAALRAELELWKESFVAQAFYDTQKLEASLLREPVKPVNTRTSTYVFVVMLMTSLLSFLPLATEKETRQTPEQINLLTPAIAAENDTEETESPVISPVARNERVIRETPAEIFLTEKVNYAVLPKRQLLPLQVIAIVPRMPVANPKKIVVKKPVVVPELTRKQRRAISKMKEKARQRRLANEFLKGNVPYVVPLNSRNF